MPFSSVIGHTRIVKLLKRSLEAGKLSHAYLFEGIDGTGMKETALALVESVFCGESEGCGKCPSCRKIAEGNHPDLHIVRPEGMHIKIDQIRDLRKALSFRPYEADKKACIIEDAERMNVSAANAFLKTLEEPPGDALLILLTSHVESLLPTIRSRCQQISFSPLSNEAIEATLTKEGADVKPSRIAAAMAGGDLARARELLAGDHLQERKRFLERAVGLSCSDIIPLFESAEEYASNKENIIYLIDLLMLFWRDILFLHTGNGEISNSDLLPLLKEKADQFTLDQVMENLELINRIRHSVMKNANPRLSLEVLFMEMANA